MKRKYETYDLKDLSLSAKIWREDDLFVAEYIEMEIASQGKSVKNAISNLKEAIKLFLFFD